MFVGTVPSCSLDLAGRRRERGDLAGQSLQTWLMGWCRAWAWAWESYNQRNDSKIHEDSLFQITQVLSYSYNKYLFTHKSQNIGKNRKDNWKWDATGFIWELTSKGIGKLRWKSPWNLIWRYKSSIMRASRTDKCSFWENGTNPSF